MKKYLITGALALVACATLTSCHSDDELSGSLIEQKLKAYEQVFEEEFGKVNPNQDWGFGTAKVSTRTRANYANSNHWGATAESDPNDPERGWIVPDTLTVGQRLRVTRYFQTHPYLDYVDPHWTNFFVQQVYTGGTDVYEGTNPVTGKSFSPEIYRSGAKLSTEDPDITSSNLNYLFAYGETEHIANFNAATASYKPVLETGEDINNGKKHNDRINLMVNSSTQEFSYQNSYSSVRRAIPWVALVSAQTIDDWADSLKTATGIEIGDPVYYGYTYSGKENKYWNRSFLGCDLELLIGDEIYADGYYFQPENYGNTYKYLKKETNQFGGDLRKYPSNPPTGDELEWLLENGYLPVINTADKEWVKPEPVADHYYSDWIVTLSKARRQDGQDPNTINLPIEPGTSSSYTQRTYKQLRYRTDLVQSGRILCEDLGTSSISDIDFNDIVFDAWMYHIVPEVRTKVVKLENNSEILLQDWSEWVDNDPNYAELGYYATDVYLLAGGGTIPATVGGVSFKNALGTDTPFLVNTVDDRDKTDIKRYGNPYDNTIGWHQPADLKDMRNINSFNEIEVVVLYNNAPVPLTSEPGEVPHKICVPVGTKWPYERIVVNEAYDFNDYVKSESSVSYEGNLENATPILNSNDEVIGYYFDERNRTDEGGNNIWTKDPTEAQTNSRYHGDITEETDITGIPYKDSARVIEGEGRYTTPEDLQYEEEAVSGGSNSGYHEGEPVLVRKRH